MENYLLLEAFAALFSNFCMISQRPNIWSIRPSLGQDNSIIVRWKNEAEMRIILNLDGASKGNPGDYSAGTGNVIRHGCDFIAGFSVYLGDVGANITCLRPKAFLKD